MTIFLNGRRPQGVTLQRGDDETMRKMKMLLALSGIWGVIWFMSLPTAVDRKNVQEMFEQARQHALQANIAFKKCRQFLDDVKKHKDNDSSLYFFSGDIWLVCDAAADVYPFVVIASYFLEPSFLPALRQTLHDEIRLTSDSKGIPQDFDLKRNRVVPRERSQVIFGASEYCKDGLAAIVEVTGKDEWFLRMKQIMDALHDEIGQGDHYGLGGEVAGNLLQVIVRLYSMTRDEKYLRWGERIADDFLLKRDFKPTVLSDHGCEIISGLTMLYGLETGVNPTKAREYQPKIQSMLDYILQNGVDADGLMYRFCGQPPEDPMRTDNWGYNYIAFLLYDMVNSSQRYRAAVEKVLLNLPKYKGFPWGCRSTGEFVYLDQLADSVEGGIYLYNRLPLPTAREWIEAEMQTLLSMDFPVHKFGANAVRTTLQYAFMQTQGLYLREWREDVLIGAVRDGETLYIYLGAEDNWAGKLCFDVPRHRELLGFGLDYPRINSFPEWFTVKSRQEFVVDGFPGGRRRVTGSVLQKGLSVNLRARQPLKLTVRLR
jgi:hypothetical protein